MTKIINGNIIRDVPHFGLNGLSKRRHSISSLNDQRLRKFRSIHNIRSDDNETTHNTESDEIGVGNNEDINTYFKEINQNYNDFIKSGKRNCNNNIFSKEYWKIKLKPLGSKALLYGFEIKLGYVFISMILSLVLGGSMYLLIDLLLIYLGTQYSQFYLDQQQHHNQQHQPEQHHQIINHSIHHHRKNQFKQPKLENSISNDTTSFSNGFNSNIHQHPSPTTIPLSSSPLSHSIDSTKPPKSYLSSPIVEKRRGSFTTLSDLRTQEYIEQLNLNSI
ncbi:hypothetical protein DLAC_03450 [Tieghemostelium lacteum]|uniref:Uncharacterized protein n=1 Tax=Tieghemostelium lacteum TaxID=361077 RepID=A0A152A2F8_TIELA|nr:hypothetical protein DLAC_03450 [Tieghemostelium lacteum]|eukprot:KYR00285.1 hypothetical protein DLAC_03450 [Tieghemostelium lacteum]